MIGHCYIEDNDYVMRSKQYLTLQVINKSSLLKLQEVGYDNAGACSRNPLIDMTTIGNARRKGVDLRQRIS